MDTEVPLESWIYFCNARGFFNNSRSRRYHRSQPSTITNAARYITHAYFSRSVEREGERKYHSCNGVTASASFGGTAARSRTLVPRFPALPGEGGRAGPRGDRLGRFWPLVASGGAEPGAGGARSRRGGGSRAGGTASGRLVCICSSFLSLFSRRCLLPRGHAGGEPASRGWEA